MRKIAIIVGHNSKSRGAIRIDTGETEYEFNGRIAKAVQDLAEKSGMFEVAIFRRSPGKGYNAQIKEVYAKADLWGATATGELHFNSSATASAAGCETLSSGSAKSLKLAGAVNNAIVKAFGVKDRGIVTRSKKQRGGASLHSGRAPAILFEPFFGSNASDCAKFSGDEAETKLAHAILMGIGEALGVKAAPARTPAPSQPAPKPHKSLLQIIKDKFL
tara:strand:+ start:41 stop:694 length:654 start_codon:yes stop_codon:yes gene_type:complete